MNILLTGGTGFLGKRVLEGLLRTPELGTVTVVTRSKSTHPDPRVKILCEDLSDPTCIPALQARLADCSAVVHLAGLYDFKAVFRENYLGNVLATMHVTRAISTYQRESGRRVPVYYASTYAVGQVKNPDLLKEEAVSRLPSRKNAYALTKAISERVVTDSGLSGAVFRLGVLVGDSSRGRIEKLDGPYYLMSFLRRAARSVPGFMRLRRIPIPAVSGGILPLVPVDAAASVICAAVFRKIGDSGNLELYGVYDPESVELRTFCSAVCDELAPGKKPLLLESWPGFLLKRQEIFTRIPKSIFEFSISPIELDNSRFVAEFGAGAVPRFESYRDSFFRGFNEYMEGNFQPVMHEVSQ